VSAPATEHAPCPRCHEFEYTRQLVTVEGVRYSGCDSCGHVWVLRADGTIAHVTPLDASLKVRGLDDRA